jgi:hypothetical protein
MTTTDKAQKGKVVKKTTVTKKVGNTALIPGMGMPSIISSKDKISDKMSKNGSSLKKKMKNGGSLSGLKASTKRVGPVDPKGAFTKVQKKTLAGAKGKATLTKDKQLGATKMAKTGAKMSKGKKC